MPSILLHTFYWNYKDKIVFVKFLRIGINFEQIVHFLSWVVIPIENS